jgi:RNA polymerase sigma-70 factor (ECF subfamily)
MATRQNQAEPRAREATLLAAARNGDEAAFAQLIEPHRAVLQAHTYRMLGSMQDAEDAVQDTLVRAWRALPRFAGRSSVRTWLYKIATNVALNAISRRPKRVVPIDYGPAADPHDEPGPPLVESVWIQPIADDLLDAADEPLGPAARYEQRESVELAFIAALQHLPARQRAALILRDVLGFSARETADILDSSVASANSALQRARQAVEQRLPEQSQQESLRSIGDEALEELVDGYLRAWEAGDVEGILALLTEDATVAMPPTATWYRGRAAIGAFLPLWPFSGPDRRVRLVPARANGQRALAAYRWDAAESCYRPVALHVLSVKGGRIGGIDAFVDPDVFRTLGLPERLAA